MPSNTLPNAFAAMALCAAGLAAQPANTILAERWDGITGGLVTSLTSNASYPDNPSSRSYPTLYELPTNVADNYGTRTRGYITPPTTGSYTFWIAGDDNAELWLGTSSDPATARLIASVPTWTNSREWTKFTQQQSAAITLTAGTRYYIETRHAEGTGGDNLAVGWQGPGITGETERPIPGTRLSPYVLTTPVSKTVLQERWDGISGGTVSSLTSNSNYPNNPTSRSYLALYEMAQNSADNYGTRTRGYITPPTTGNYTFWIAGDDNAELWLGTSSDPATARLIASAPTWTNSREWTKFTQQQSAAIALTAGTRYYIETRFKEATGNDNMAVGWQGPGITGEAERPIPGTRLAPFLLGTLPAITTQPSSQAANVGQAVTFSVTATGAAPLSYQWRRGGTNIAGATSSTYTTPTLAASDDGSQFTVLVSNASGSILSNTAVLTINTPPTITTQSGNQTVVVGQPGTLSVVAAGTAPLSYQWSLNSMTIPGATSSVYVTPATVAADDGAIYSVVVSNIAGSVTSSPIKLIVLSPPVIVTQPASQTVNVGSSTATFAVATTGSAPFSYQWRKNGVNISGANSAVYSPPQATMADNGALFSVVVSNQAGSVTSANAVLTVIDAPSIVSQPASLTVTLGQTATFSVVASSAGPLTYQWIRNTTSIPGATSSSYTTPPTTAADDGALYYVQITNSAASITSTTAMLTVNSPPVITTQPSSLTVNPGQFATFLVFATGTAPLSYQWSKNGVPIPGATASTYNTPAATAADNYSTYSVVVSNVAGSVTSATAVLGVNPLPVITTQPASVAVNPGQVATFSVVATSTLPLTYQWRKNGANISGATASSYSTPATTSADNGAQFSVVVSNSAGATTSTNAILNINTAPVITSHPTNMDAIVGQPVTFTVTAVGTAPLAYQWRRNGGNIAGANAASYTIAQTTLADDGAFFSVVVSNGVGSATSISALLSVMAPPVITAQPAPRTVVAGQTATFSVTVTGSAGFIYQWRKNGVNVGGSSSTYTTPATTAADDGALFSVVISNGFGTVTSANALLTVTSPPVITVQPVNQTAAVGQPATFSVTATGTAPLAYQWRRNSANISGATSASYTTPPTTSADNGAIYSVVVSNSSGSVTSAPAVLTVNMPPVITLQPLDQTVLAGQPATFSVTATGSSPLSYQWRKNGVNISGAVSSSYTTPPATASDNGALFSVVISNGFGTVTSGNALLTVNAATPPAITLQPGNQTVTGGQSASFSVTATGTAPLAYQWRKNGVNISGATASSYLTPATLSSDNGALFSVVVSNSAGSVTSSNALLTVIVSVTNNHKLSVSGELVDVSGNPLGYPTPVTVDAIVNLYNDSSAGTSLYTETFRAAASQGIRVSNGLFVARLGEGTTTQNLQQVITANGNLWVEVTIDDGTPDILRPRTPLTAAPYALGGTPAPTLAPALTGSGDPNSLNIDGQVGATYVNSEDNSTWFKLKSAWKRLD